MSLLDGEPRSATIVATTDLRLLVVERSHFWRLLDETPDLVQRILTISVASRATSGTDDTHDTPGHESGLTRGGAELYL